MKIAMSKLTFYEAEEFHKLVLGEVKSAKKQFTLDFSQVEKIDFCGIQLLLSLKKYCEANRISFTLTNVNAPKVRQAFLLMDLDPAQPRD